MRIIGGTHKGRILEVYKNLKARPTTDFAKTGLFNILNNQIELDGIDVLDLFSGTGSIAFEFASRGAAHVTTVESNSQQSRFIQDSIKKLGFNNMSTRQSDVFKFLKAVSGTTFDLIFADPPYELENISEIHQLVFEHKLLKPDGILIIEHGERTDFSMLSGFTKTKNYGAVNFSFFGY